MTTAAWVLRSFNDLSELLDPGKPSRTDKVSIIADAIKAITQLRAESHQMKQLNKFLEVRSALFLLRALHGGLANTWKRRSRDVCLGMKATQNLYCRC